jgi:hypothetical protein
VVEAIAEDVVEDSTSLMSHNRNPRRRDTVSREDVDKRHGEVEIEVTVKVIKETA